jgi:hypothetical protein
MIVRKLSIEIMSFPKCTGSIPLVVLLYLRVAHLVTQMVAQIPPTAKTVAMIPKMMVGMSTDE